jgi:ribosomal protein L28
LSGNRRFDPNYQNISGYVSKELAIKFRQHIAAKGLKINEGLEEALRMYLETEKDSKAEPKNPS